MDPANVRQSGADGSEYDASSAAPDQGASAVEMVSIKKTANGAFVTECQDGPSAKPETNSFNAFPELVAYLGQKFNAAPETQEQPEVEQAEPPPTGT